MAGLAEVIQAAAGQPASVRIGAVVSTGPLVVTVQGVQFNADALGVLSSYSPAPGDIVALLGQSTASGSDPTSWVVLGRVVPA